jgi:hypothetical protein
MTARVSADSLRLSIVSATDTYETLRPVIQSLRRQIDREHLEIVIIAPGESLVRIVRKPDGRLTAQASACELSGP